MGNAIRKIVHLDQSRILSIEVPQNMGSSVELIVLSCDDEEEAAVLDKVQQPLTEDELFLISAYAATTEESSEEDEIWERYLHAS